MDLGAAWLAAMHRNDFAAAWQISDAVLAAHDPAQRDDPALPYHQRWVWDGRPFEGRHVLVRCYHGLGDTLQFCRYLPALRQQVASLTLEVQAPLLDLLRDVPGPDRLVPFDPAHPLPASACDLEIMELAHALRLPPPPPLQLRRPPATLTGGIGVCWQAGGWGADRSMPLRALAPLADVPGARLISLQRGAAAEDVLRPDAPPVLNPQDRSMNMATTAALIAGLDVVVTVDTMVAHLAGALGRPAAVLLLHEADWRWGSGDRTPWYPVAKLYRQSAPGDWHTPVAQLAADLAHGAVNIREPLEAVAFVAT